MGKKLSALNEELKVFINKQPLFFVGTAADTGKMNISPKGMDSMRIINQNKIVWLNLTGSGNETAAHLTLNDRMTILFCSFEGKPLILRLYGTAKAYHERDQEFHDYLSLFPEMKATRQIVAMNIDLVQTSCGFGIPIMEFKEDRDLMTKWANKKDDQQIKDYWKEKNTESLDGFDTHIFE